MKALSVLQMFFGALAGADTYFLILYKAKIVEIPPPLDGDGFWLTGSPPDATLEWVLLGCGVILLACALFQLKRGMRFSGWQAALGGLMAAAGVFFTVRASVINYFEHSALYYAMYPLLCVGAAVVVIGLIQLVKRYPPLPEKHLPH
jgi:hypothetical protein